MISFDDGDMQFPEEELPQVSTEVHDVVREAQRAGVWVFGAGFHTGEFVDVINQDGSLSTREVTDQTKLIGGFSLVNVSGDDEARAWAAKFARACRCAQMVRQIMDDPEAHTANPN